MTNEEHLLPQTDSIFGAELTCASKRFVAGRAAEQLPEDRGLTAQLPINRLCEEATRPSSSASAVTAEGGPR